MLYWVLGTRYFGWVAVLDFYHTYRLVLGTNNYILVSSDHLFGCSLRIFKVCFDKAQLWLPWIIWLQYQMYIWWKHNKSHHPNTIPILFLQKASYNFHCKNHLPHLPLIAHVLPLLTARGPEPQLQERYNRLLVEAVSQPTVKWIQTCLG